MKAFYCDTFVLPLPDGHRFPMQKYRLLRETLLDEPGLTLTLPDPVDDDTLARAHTLDYIQRASRGQLSAQEVRELGFPWSPQLVERSRRSAGATVQAARAALDEGVAVNLAGGTHHAFADHGAGFCLFNDSVIAARALQAEGLVERVLVVDTDVHQGNGTAAIAAGDESLFTLSIHGQHNYPLRKEESDLDLGLPDQTGDEDYLTALERGLEEALQRSRPNLVLFVSGADPFEGDRLGRLKLTLPGLRRRDELVLRRCQGLPVAISMAGGYAHDVADTVAIHVQTVKAALAR